MKRPALWSLIAIIIAIVFTALSVPVFLCLICGCFLFAFPLLDPRFHWYQMIAIFIIYGISLFSAYSVFSVKQFDSSLYNKNCQITGVVASVPEEKEQYTRWTLKLIGIEGTEADGKLLVSYYEDGKNRPDIQPGDVIVLSGKITEASEKRNPGGFNYHLYLKGKGIDALFYSGDNSAVQIIGHSSNPVYGIECLQIKMSAACNHYFGSEESVLVRSLLFGDKSKDTTVKDAFSDAGISHVLAVSGLHVGFLLMLLDFIFSLLHIKNQKVELYILFPVLLFYIILTGVSTSVIRASIMLLAVKLGNVKKRHYDMLSGICTAASLILLFEPAQLFAAGFELSFCAVLGICFFYKPILFQSEKIFGISGKISDSFILTYCALVGTLPVMLYHFQSVNFISFLSNLIVVPLVGILLVMAFITVPIMTAVPSLGSVVCFIPNIMAKLIIKLTHIFASFDFLIIHRGVLSIPELILFIIIAFSFAGYFNFKHSREYLTVSIGTALMVCIIFVSGIIPKDLKVTYLDVGQGDSALVETPYGGAYLIDGGGYQKEIESNQNKEPISESVLLPALYSKGITHLDGVVISHNHADHCQGIEELLTEIPVSKIYLSTKYNGDGLEKQRKIPVEILAKGSHFRTGDGVDLKVLWPDERMEAVSDDEQNESSLVIKLSYGQRSFLFTGDAGNETEPQLSAVDCDADVLKVGHHGSNTATSLEFLKKVTPSVAVISVGKNNMYGHPAPETIRNLKNANIRYYRTDQNGAVEIETNGKNLKIHSFLDQ